jgi:nanoRNase/pAp phosphatase (c-di-AMP/oligoRNAs hydrolase)
MDLIEICCEVDGTGSGSCPMTGLHSDTGKLSIFIKKDKTVLIQPHLMCQSYNLASISFAVNMGGIKPSI